MALGAIELAVRHNPDLIIMDVGMKGMDGIAATRALKADRRTQSIPVIMLTARSNPSDIVRGLEAGAQEYLSKPFDVTEVLARVRTVHRLASAHKDLDRLNARLEIEVNQKAQRLQILYEYMRDLNHAASEILILELILRATTEVTGAKRVSIFTRDEANDELVCRLAIGLPVDSADEIRVPEGDGITGHVFRTGKTVTAKAFGHAASDEKYDCQAFVSTPLISADLETREGTIGVLNVTNRPDDGAFSDDEVDCIRSIADAGAIALDNIKRRLRLEQSVRVLLQTLGLLAEYRDEETTAHLQRVSKMARTLAERLREAGIHPGRINDEFIDALVQAAPMHDIGKVGIPDHILTKPGKLTEDEFLIMRTHTDIGRRVLSRAMDPACPNPLLQMCVDIAYCHHERWDGCGYPQGVRGADIPLAARIIALVDAYDAMTSERRYKAAIPHDEAVRRIRGDAGSHFDPAIVEAFCACQSDFQAVLRTSEDPKFLAFRNPLQPVLGKDQSAVIPHR